MEFSTLSVARGPNSPLVLWGDAHRLVVVITTHADVGKGTGLFAYGVDPETGAVMFSHSFAANGLGEFLRFVVDGPVQQKAGNVVEYPNPPVEPPGPKAQVLVDYARVVRSGEEFAQLGGPGQA